MKDVNGFPVAKGDIVALLAVVLEADAEGVQIRIMNSEMELTVSCAGDEVLGYTCASELQKIQAPEPAEAEVQSA